MGADLVGFMVRGPMGLDPALKDRALLLAQGRSKAIANFCGAHADLKQVTAPPPPSQPLEQPVDGILRIAELKETYRKAALEMEELGWNMERAEDVYDDLCADGVENGFTDEEVSQAVDSIFEIWNGVNIPRDAHMQSFVNKNTTADKVLFVGERTWGDEPSGHGYRTVKTLRMLGVLDFLGLES